MFNSFLLTYSFDSIFLDLTNFIFSSNTTIINTLSLYILQVGLASVKKTGKYVFWGYGYKEQETYIIQVLDKNERTIDVFPVKTVETLVKILSNGLLKRIKKGQIKVMMLPNPVELPKGYWEEYRKAKNGYERVEIAKKYGILTDKSILILKVIALDIDSKFEEVYPVWEELRKKLGIEEGYEVFRTKSGRFRVYIYLEPTRFEVKKTEVVNGEKIEKTEIKEFWERPHTVSRNGHTHLQNVRELVAILCAYFQKKGLNADTTFVDRINHPVFLEGLEVNGKKSELMERKGGYAGKLYDLYRKVKELQSKEGLWTLRRGNREVNLTEKFWGRKVERKNGEIKEKRRDRVIALRKWEEGCSYEEKFSKWKKAVDKLAEKHNSGRFLKVIVPAITWAKDLGLDRSDVDDYLCEVLSDRSVEKMEKDLEIAWNMDITDRFKWWKKERENDKESLREKALKEIYDKGGGIYRQELLREVFKGQVYLLEEIMRGLEEERAIEVRFEKVGRGRPRKVYVLTEKGKEILLGKPQQEVRKVAVGQDFYQRDFSLYINFSLEEQCSGLVDWLDNATVGSSCEEVLGRLEISENITDKRIREKSEELLGITTYEEEKKKNKGRRIEKLIQGRKIYAKSWKFFKFVRKYLEDQGVQVIDTRYKDLDTGQEIDGKKLLKLVRFLLTNEVKTLNLAGWGRYAKLLGEILKSVGLINEEVEIILPKTKNIEELEIEVLREIGLSEKEITKYLELSDEGKLNFLEENGILEEYQKKLENKSKGIVEGNKEEIKEFNENDDKRIYDNGEIPF